MQTNTLRISSFLLFALFLLVSSCKKDSEFNVNRHHRKAVGESAFDLLSDKKYEKAVIEIQYMTGFAPTEAALTNLKTFLGQRLNKKDGIRYVYSEIAARGQSTYTLADVKDIEDASRTQFTRRKELAVYFLFLDGDYVETTESSAVVGLAYYNTSMVVFQKTVDDYTGGFGQPEQYKVESTVLLHEFGHLLGLVNLGSDMQVNHQDTAHGNHCDNENCLMNWEVGTGNFMQNLTGTAPIPSLDQHCLDDLQANGGK